METINSLIPNETLVRQIAGSLFTVDIQYWLLILISSYTYLDLNHNNIW